MQDLGDFGLRGLDGVLVGRLEIAVALAVVADHLVLGRVTLGFGQIGFVESLVGPGEHGDLAAGVVDVVVGLDVVARVLEDACERVADDRVACAADVDWSSGIGGGVLDDDTGVLLGEVAEVLGLGLRDRVFEVLLARQEVHVRALGLDGLDVVVFREVDLSGDVGGHFRGRCADFAGETVGRTRCEDGRDVLGRLLDTEIVGREVEAL